MAIDLTREPVTLAQAKLHLGVRLPNRDDEIAGLVIAAREKIETYTGRALTRRVITQAVDGSEPGPFIFELGPVHEVRAIRYLTAEGEMAEVAPPFRAIGPIGNRWRLFTARSSAASWSTGQYAEVEYEAGYGARITEGEGRVPIPAPFVLIRAILLLVGLWFENHEAAVVGTTVLELPHGVKDICRDFRPAGVE